MELPEAVDQPEDDGGEQTALRRRRFARLIFEGLDPYEAYRKVGFSFGGLGGGRIQTANRMAAEPWCQMLILGWTVNPHDQVRIAVPEAIQTLVIGLADRTREGRLSNLAIRCAENLLDRGGIVRSQKVEHQDAAGSAATKDAAALVRLIKERLEQLEGPVMMPPALAPASEERVTVVEVKRVDVEDLPIEEEEDPDDV